MPDYLSEADWKDLLKKPKNLGLKMQGTGVSKKLREYEDANEKLQKNPSLDTVDGALKAVRALKQHATAESKEHKAFKEATDYLKDIATAAGDREDELMKQATLLGSLEILRAGLERVDKFLGECDTAADFTNSDTKSLVQSIRGLAAACSKSGVPELVNFGKKGGALTSNEFLVLVKDENLSKCKKKVTEWRDGIENALEEL